MGCDCLIFGCWGCFGRSGIRLFRVVMIGGIGFMVFTFRALQVALL